MNESCKTYYKELALAGSVYIAVVVASVYLLTRIHLGYWRVPVAVAPVLPAALIVRAIIRHIRRMDELQARIQLESMAFAFAATAMLTLTYGFLQNAGFPNVNWVWVWPLMGVMLSVGTFFAKRKYQ